MMDVNLPYGTGDASFRAAGGEEGIKRLVDDFYSLMAEDPGARRIFDMHPKGPVHSAERLTAFLCGWLGGPHRYAERYGHGLRLPMAHAHLPIRADDKEAWLACMREAIARQPYEPAFAQYLLRALSVPAERIVSVCSMTMPSE